MGVASDVDPIGFCGYEEVGGVNLEIVELAEHHLERLTELDPTGSSARGTDGDEARLTDVSPDGISELDRLNRETLSKVTSIVVDNPTDKMLIDSMSERLNSQIELFESGVWMRDLNILFSPLQSMRLAFDLMAKTTEEEKFNLIKRVESVPALIGQMISTLELGKSQGELASRRQAVECMRQARALAGDTGYGFFGRLMAGSSTSGNAVQAEAAKALQRFANYLEDEYLPSAPDRDGAGGAEWKLRCRQFNGMEFDPEDTYEWGWEELRLVQKEMDQIAAEISPGIPLQEVFRQLDNDEKLKISGETEFLGWNQSVIDRAMAELAQSHFDIPEAIQRCEAMLAPPGGAAAMYYTRPSSDLSRPGRTWYPTRGRSNFSLWNEMTVVYHESVPGHHLQLGLITYLGNRLNAFQRVLGQTSGLSEGWALYAESLMDELGLFPGPAFRLGMFSSQAFRSARVVVDIGLHHGYEIPDGWGRFSGERWTPDLAVDFMVEVTGLSREFMSSEIDRYLGVPAQATSYKLGHRVWREARFAAERSKGSAFDLKSFHMEALGLGFVGLDQLRSAFEG